MFERKMIAGWGDIDFNSHMRNTAYMDRSGDLRMMFFDSQGFTVKDFMQRKIGPVVKKDEIEYFSEIHLLEEFTVTLYTSGMAENGSRFRLHNDFYAASGKLAAKVTSTGGWLDLVNRKLVAPPQELFELMSKMPKSEHYEVLTASVKA